MQEMGPTAFRSYPRSLEHILLGYFKTLSVGSAWVLNPDVPHGSPALILMS